MNTKVTNILNMEIQKQERVLEFNDIESEKIRIDMGRLTTGFFRIKLKSENVKKIHILYGPVKDLISFEMTIPIPEDDELFVCYDDYITARYLDIYFEGYKSDNLKKVIIEDIGLEFSAYSGKLKGEFKSDDKLMNKIWEMGAYTLRLCMQKNIYSQNYVTLPKKNAEFVKNWKSNYSDFVIFDGPRRDREVWVGDLRTEGLLDYCTFGEYNIMKSSLQIFYDLQKPNGVIPGSASSWQEFKEYNLWWVISYWEAYLYSGDQEFFDYLYPGIELLIDWVLENIDENGFLYNESTWMWTFPRDGYGGATQCILYFMLNTAAKIEKKALKPDKAKKIKEIAKKTKEQINIEFFDEDKGAYFDYIHIKENERVYLSDINVYAICFGITKEENINSVLDYLKENMWNKFGSTTIDKKVEIFEIDKKSKSVIATLAKQSKNPKKMIERLMWVHNKQIWPFIVAYEVEAFFIGKRVDDALELIKRCWGNMASKETGTFWEMVDYETGEFSTQAFQEYSETDSNNSAAHAWSGWISFLMTKYLLGIDVLKSGCSRIEISPLITEKIKNLEGKFPTPNGDLFVKINHNKNNLSISVTKPKETDIQIKKNETWLDREVDLEVNDAN